MTEEARRCLPRTTNEGQGYTFRLRVCSLVVKTWDRKHKTEPQEWDQDIKCLNDQDCQITIVARLPCINYCQIGQPAFLQLAYLNATLKVFKRNSSKCRLQRISNSCSEKPFVQKLIQMHLVFYKSHFAQKFWAKREFAGLQKTSPNDINNKHRSMYHMLSLRTYIQYTNLFSLNW